jgi:predicted nucleotidyltransferase
MSNDEYLQDLQEIQENGYEECVERLADEIVIIRIEKSIELICHLYRHGLITDAYIVGSLAKGTSRKESDIDIIIINPILLSASDIPPIPTILPYSQSEEEKLVELLQLSITGVLQDIGVEFKEMYLKDIKLWYQLYKEEIFHIMTSNYFKGLTPYIQITRDLCNS